MFHAGESDSSRPTSELPVTPPSIEGSKRGHGLQFRQADIATLIGRKSYTLFCCNASRRIRFSSKGDLHERIHRHDLLRQRLRYPRVLGTLVADRRNPVHFLLHSRVLLLWLSAAGRRVG